MGLRGFLSGLPTKREAIRRFTPSWFTVVMGTGSLALNIAGFPWSFGAAQRGIALAFWCLGCLLFLTFVTMGIARAIMFTDVLGLMIRHPAQSLFLGCIPMAFSTLCNGILAILMPYLADPEPAARTALALYWTNLPVVVFAILLVPWFMFTEHAHAIEKATAIWLLPVVPACVAAGSAGALLSNRTAFPYLSPAEIEGLLLSGYTLGGAGLLLAYSIITMYTQRLLVHKLPPADQVVSAFIPTGPLTMIAWALLRLGEGAQMALRSGELQAATGDTEIAAAWASFLAAAHGTGPVLGLLLWGFGTWWWIVALATVGSTLRTLPFSIGWWGSIFPTGVLATATASYGAHFGSVAFKGMAAAFIVAQALLWGTTAFWTLRGAWVGTMFVAPCLTEPTAAGAAAGVPTAGDIDKPGERKGAPESADSFSSTDSQNGESGALTPPADLVGNGV
ncbi:voltage-dependent anion channel [Hyaloraphidium curvatum]|nr:voltage-dependent anion channel [Hyaloraphidium curvatum]